MPSQIQRALQPATPANLLITFEYLSQIYVPSELKDPKGKTARCQNLLNLIGRAGMQLHPIETSSYLLALTQHFQGHLPQLCAWEGLPELALRPDYMNELEVWASVLQTRLDELTHKAKARTKLMGLGRMLLTMGTLHVSLRRVSAISDALR